MAAHNALRFRPAHMTVRSGRMIAVVACPRRSQRASSPPAFGDLQDGAALFEQEALECVRARTVVTRANPLPRTVSRRFPSATTGLGHSVPANCQGARAFCDQRGSVQRRCLALDEFVAQSGNQMQPRDDERGG